MKRSAIKPKPRPSVMGDVREQVIERDGHVCRLSSPDCQGAPQVHHVLTRGRGGADEASNAILLCLVHHGSVHARPEQSWAVGLLAHQWDELGAFWVRLHDAGLAARSEPSPGATA